MTLRTILPNLLPDILTLYYTARSFIRLRYANCTYPHAVDNSLYALSANVSAVVFVIVLFKFCQMSPRYESNQKTNASSI